MSEPGLLRYEFGSQNMVMCVVHTSDLPETAVRESCLFLGSDAVGPSCAVPTAAPAVTWRRPRWSIGWLPAVDPPGPCGCPTSTRFWLAYRPGSSGGAPAPPPIGRRGPSSSSLSDPDYGRRTAALHEGGAIRPTMSAASVFVATWSTSSGRMLANLPVSCALLIGSSCLLCRKVGLSGSASFDVAGRAGGGASTSASGSPLLRSLQG
nr:hypothetical protein [Salinispora pacifica]